MNVINEDYKLQVLSNHFSSRRWVVRWVSECVSECVSGLVGDSASVGALVAMGCLDWDD